MLISQQSITYALNFPPQIGARGMRWSVMNQVIRGKRALTVPFGHSALPEEPLRDAPVLLKNQTSTIPRAKQETSSDVVKRTSLSVFKHKSTASVSSVMCRAHLNERKSARWDAAMRWDAYSRALFPRLNFRH